MGKAAEGDSERNIVRLEQQLKGLTEKYDILPLDYDSAVADRQNVDDDSDSQLMRKRHMLEEERDHFKSLYEASHLLLKAANLPLPWETQTRSSAARIAETLGYLPLALIHAGKAIMNGLCPFINYLDFYSRSWEPHSQISKHQWLWRR